MATEKWLIDANPIKKFIVDGLNNPDRKKAFGHDAIEILTEIEYAPTVDAEPVIHAYWIKEQDELGIDRGWKCSNCRGSVYEMTYEPYEGCPHCRAKMDGERKKIALEDIVDLDAQTAANNEAMRRVIDFMVGGS